MPRYFDNPADMEPLLPADRDGALTALGWQVIRRAERLGAALHPVTARGLAAVFRVMNSYYSHLIEGHHTKPADLDAVMKHAPKGTAERRQLQALHLAHLKTQSAMEHWLAADPAPDITQPEFIGRLHGSFYEALPETARVVAGNDGVSHPLTPGRWRDFSVAVGRHLAPRHDTLPAFMKRFAAFF